MPDAVTHKKEKIADDVSYSKAIEALSGVCGEYVYCLEEDIFYLYENGYWRHIYEIEMLDRISRGININHQPLSQRRQMLENMKIIKYQHLTAFNWAELLNVKNGMVNAFDGVCQDHDSIFYSTMRLDYEYCEDVKCDLWLKTLMGIFENNQQKINLLQEFFGYCLTRDTKQEKALLLLGDSRSGKSTILNTLQYMIGTENCSHVALKNLNNPQYTGMMVNKLVNIDGEVSKKADDFEAEFKTIVTGHEVVCNEKYVAPFKFRPFCKFIMSANEFPKITDHSSAFYKRLILIPCERVFIEKEQNKNLRNELLVELPAILNWAVEGLKRMNGRGRFEDSDFMREAIQELEDENNPVNGFFQEHLEIVFGGEVEKGDLYDKYKSWAVKSTTYILSKARFASCVYKKYHKETPKDTQNMNTKKRIWRNLRYVDIKNAPAGQEVQGWQE